MILYLLSCVHQTCDRINVIMFHIISYLYHIMCTKRTLSIRLLPTFVYFVFFNHTCERTQNTSLSLLPLGGSFFFFFSFPLSSSNQLSLSQFSLTLSQGNPIDSLISHSFTICLFQGFRIENWETFQGFRIGD